MSAGNSRSAKSAKIAEACQALCDASSLLRQALGQNDDVASHNAAMNTETTVSRNLAEALAETDRSRPMVSAVSSVASPSWSTPLTRSTTQRSDIRARGIRDELRRCFSSSGGSRRRNRNGHRATNTSLSLTNTRPTWPHVFVALSEPNHDWIPTTNERKILTKAGLGEKKLHMPTDLNGNELIRFLYEAYPKLESAGGIEICRSSRGARKIERIDCPPEGYTQRNLALEAGQAKLYLRPIQHELDLTPTVANVVESLQVGYTAYIYFSCLAFWPNFMILVGMAMYYHGSIFF